MIYLIGIRVAQDSGLVYFEGSRKECFLEILRADSEKRDAIIATDEIGNFEKFVRFLGCDYQRVSGGPNAQFYDSLQDYEDDIEHVVGYDRFLAKQSLEIAKASEPYMNASAEQVHTKEEEE